MDNEFLSMNCNSLISRLWDLNVEVRAVDLESGSDYTYNNIIRPWVLEHMRNISEYSDLVLDIGSGCGFLTSFI